MNRMVVRRPTFGQLGFHRDPFRHDEVVEFDPLFMGDMVVQVDQVFDDTQNTRIGEGITDRIQYLGADVRSHCPTFVSRSFFWFDLSKATKLIHRQWDVVDVVKFDSLQKRPT